MKTSNLHLFFSLLFLAFSSFSCHLSAHNTIEGNGILKTRSYEISSFDGVLLQLPATVNYTVSDEYTCSVTIDENLFEYLSIGMKDDRLKLGIAESHESVDLEATSFVIEISGPTLKAINLGGSGDFKFLTPFQSDKLEVSVAGSGDVLFTQTCNINHLTLSLAGSGDVDCQQLMSDNTMISIAGSGDVNISSGSIVTMDVVIAGSGSVETYCDTRDLKVKISGSGEVTANVSNNLYYDVVGSGKINYYGNPNLKGKGSKNALNQLEY